jgi:Tfp pilus assembly protein PilF
MLNTSFQRMNTISVAVFGIAIVLVVSLSGCATPKKAREEAEFHLRIGTSHLVEGNYPRALSELLLAAKMDPGNPLVQNNIGLVYFFQQHYGESLQHFENALKIRPTFMEARNNHARTLIELEHYDQAISELKTVIGDLTYPDPSKAWVNMGVAYFRKKDFASARDRFSKAIQIDRNNCLAVNYFGRALYELGKLTDAAQALDNAIVVCKSVKFDEPHYFSGLTYYKLGKTNSAIARMEEVMQLFPHGPYAGKAESMLKLMR